MKIRKEYTCPLEIVHDIIKGKWKTIIIFTLKYGNMSLSQMENSIEGITQKMLLQHLHELKEWGVVEKVNSKGYPLHVEYFLSERGKKILKSVEIMQEIGIEYMVEHGQTEILDKKGISYTK